MGWAGAAIGVWLTGMRRRARLVVPFSAGVLLGVAVFGLAPELAGEMGWMAALGMGASGYFLLLAIDRYVSPVCPTCSHDHDHTGCQAELHGFAAPLIVAAALHSFLDGWGVTTAQISLPLGLRIAVPLAVALHKIPEGIALGGILRPSVGSRATALAWCLLAEGDAGRGDGRSEPGGTWATSGSPIPWGLQRGGFSSWAGTRCTRSGRAAGRGRRSFRHSPAWWGRRPSSGERKRFSGKSLRINVASGQPGGNNFHRRMRGIPPELDQIRRRSGRQRGGFGRKSSRASWIDGGHTHRIG